LHGHDCADQGWSEAAKFLSLGVRPALEGSALLIVHFEETRIRSDVICPQQLHHRLHVVATIASPFGITCPRWSRFMIP
jgi:hypothetical protein